VTSGGWEIVRVEQVGEIITGKTPSTQDPMNYGTDLPFIKPPDVYGGRVVRSAASGLSKKGKAFARLLPPGSVLVTCIGVLGRVAITGMESATNQQINAIVPNTSRVLPKWLLFACQAPDFQRQLLQASTATTVRLINARQFSKLTLPLAPLDEQEAIVEEVEKQFTRIEAGQAFIRQGKASLVRCRLSLIQRWVTGVPGASRFWEEVEIGEVADVVTGNTPSTKDPSNYEGEIPFFKPKDLNAGYYVKKAESTLSDKGASLARLISAGSVMVTSIGATTGKTGLARVGGATNQQINSVVPRDLDQLVPEWLYWFFVSPQGQQLIWSNTSSTTLPILNKGRFLRLRVPLLPRDVQVQVVEMIERGVSVIDATAQQLDRASLGGNRLRSLILIERFTEEQQQAVS
jgi:type I restriction enzyme S subunit